MLPTSRSSSASTLQPGPMDKKQAIDYPPITAAINIPSPPLTPHLGHTYDYSSFQDDVHPDDDLIFSSRFRTNNTESNPYADTTPSYQRSILRHSAPAVPSPLSLRSSMSIPKGFTFSNNISETQPKEERESYKSFLKTMEEDYWKSVSTIRSTYFFDGIGCGGGFLAIPHIASHGNAKTNVICRLLEQWLTRKLVEPTISDSIPVLEDNIESSVQSIERHLRHDLKVWAGISQAFIHIRCGHVFMLDACCDDETIVHLGADEFYQDYPLFVDVEIKMHCDANHLPKTDPTEVLIAFRNVVSRNKGQCTEAPFVHRTIIRESTGTEVL
ncbi:hypothetical protein BGZ94_005401 [Podila epigama]|nr:hypothetical protein BGZ94_005401 [Podila epigama]